MPQLHCNTTVAGRGVRWTFLWLLAWTVSLIGCRAGSLLLLDPSDSSGTSVGQCNFTNLTGRCPGGYVCHYGICFKSTSGQADASATPVAACDSANPNGKCSGTDTCRDGTCIPLYNPCSTANPQGACPGAQVCIAGECFDDDGTLICSNANPTGACPPGKVCSSGRCRLHTPSCSAINPAGACPPWYTCVSGVCNGPIAPDSCGASNVLGRCPADQVCVAGTCTPLTENNQCSETIPFGLCPTGASCVSGACVAIDTDSRCSPTKTDGLCQGGATCNNGTCTLLNCGAGGFACGLGSWCSDATSCIPLPCDAVHPEGACADATLACDRGVCAPAGCSWDHPDGTCATGLVCRDGDCSQPDCSSQAPYGWCPAGEECQNYVCTKMPCSLANVDGPCSGETATYSPVLQSLVRLPKVCCNTALRLSTGCELGTCTRPTCSLEQPYGLCGLGQYCAQGTCTDAPCSAYFPLGYCENGEICYNGRCTKTNCTSQPPGFCSPGTCNPTTNRCTRAECSRASPTGSCEQGICLPVPCSTPGCIPDYQCTVPPCSTDYPGGSCTTADQLCVQGKCLDPPCSTAFPHGQCAVNYVCTNGTCERASCSDATPLGFCNNAADGTRQVCLNGQCKPFACSADFPQGPCSQAGERCLDTTPPACAPPECSEDYPGGRCSDSAAVCVQAACRILCSDSRKTGWCPQNAACVNGACTPPKTGDLDSDTIADDVENSATCTAHNSDQVSCTATSGCLWNITAAACQLDTDGDGSPDLLDRDADNDTISDKVEALGGNLDDDGDGQPRYRDLDSDGDSIPDQIEVGPAPATPRNSDKDGLPDYRDSDSDGDGIYDHCEVSDSFTLCAVSGLALATQNCPTRVTQQNCMNAAGCKWNSVASACSFVGVFDTDADGLPDYLDLDSDGDGISDAIEARSRPSDAGSFVSQGVDHDSDRTPDYRDLDSDGDGVQDKDEDVNGDGIVNCQIDGARNTVADLRSEPSCSASDYDYNPGCSATPQKKCLMAETSRVHVDTDQDGIADGTDGIYYVCSTSRLKSVNLFYSRAADFALALETEFNTARKLTRSTSSGRVEAGFTFDDTLSSNGSAAVSAFILQRPPSAAAETLTNPSDPARQLIDKALAQAAADLLVLDTKTNTAGVGRVIPIINRNFTSFDGFGVVVSHYEITLATGTTDETNVVRDKIVRTLGGASLETWDGGPRRGSKYSTFSLLTQTLYRYDKITTGDAGSVGSVLVVGALVAKGTNVDTPQSFLYRPRCAEQSAGACAARTGCLPNSLGACEEIPPESTNPPPYQIPLFFADNITNGSALAQFGDDLAALCQSQVQKYSELDILWIVDNSGSMSQEIDQVLRSSQLFFSLLNNTEADYRIAQTTTAANRISSLDPAGWPAAWPPLYRFDKSTEDSNIFNSTYDETNRIRGALVGGFTGMRAGRTTGLTDDRSFAYDCTLYPNNYCFLAGDLTSAGNCCPACACSNIVSRQDCLLTNNYCKWDAATSACIKDPTNPATSRGIINDPSCYFASRLPDSNGSGNEYGLLMGEWAMYRGGASVLCSQATQQSTCASLPGCIWNSATNLCRPAYCQTAATDFATCEVPPSTCRSFKPLGKAGCNAANSGTCVWVEFKNVGDCVSKGCYYSSCSSTPPYTCTVASSTVCRNRSQCVWRTPPYGSNNYCSDKGTYGGVTGQLNTPAPASCEWNGVAGQCEPSLGIPCYTATTEAACTALQPQCTWSASASLCYPSATSGDVLCDNVPTKAICDTYYNCSWNAATSRCDTPSTRRFRPNSTRIAVVLGDEEDCYVRDNDLDGNCEWVDYASGPLPYTHPIRQKRTEAYLQFYKARGFTLFAIVGDKADPAKAPAKTNGGCQTIKSGYDDQAEAGQVYIQVAEGTGGGWGSICSLDLYPTIESIVVGSLAQASPYRLEASLNGVRVQPIASTIKVAVEVCANPDEYLTDPTCATGGRVMRVVPRSRENGFDYDARYNVIVLYGTARPALNGDIVVSYRHWKEQTTHLETTQACPCPSTTGNCACPQGQACGIAGTQLPITHIDRCAPLATQNACEAQSGCSWNSATTGGGCVANGLCEPDPTCGGICVSGRQICVARTGMCECDLTCGGGCPAGQVCNNSDPYAPNCGTCSCDTSCGEACIAEVATCNANTSSPSCGRCLCKTNCDGRCSAEQGQICDSDPNSLTCGSCKVDPQCGRPNGECNPNCGSATTAPQCALLAGCRFATWLNACIPTVCTPCSASSGRCEADPFCCYNCGPGEICDPRTGACICDTTCSGGCGPGQYCDSATDSPTCGQCRCDTTCGGGCPTDSCLRCDSNLTSARCGLCVPDVNCGGSCPFGFRCNSITGCCVTDEQCGGLCPPGTSVCNPYTGTCEALGE